MRKGILLPLCGIGLLGLSACMPERSISQEELVRRTQELVSAVAGGNQVPWKKYFADDCKFFDERGRNMDKKTLVGEITPLPEGSS